MSWRVSARVACLFVFLLAARPVSAAWSAARTWDEAAVEAIRHDAARPPVHARNLFHVSVAMYDAWAAYDATAEQFLVHERATAPDIEAARAEAISHAAYTILKARFANSPGAAITLPHLDAVLDGQGYDHTDTGTTGVSAAALGNRIGAAVLAFGLTDGANEQNNYVTTNSYTPVNPPLVVGLPGDTNMIDPNRWQPLALDYFVDQNGVHVGAYPAFICPHWGSVVPFELRHGDPSDPAYDDPGAPPYYNGVGHDDFIANMLQILQLSSELTPDDGVMIDISPATLGNNPLPSYNGTGYTLNPVTGLPYAPNLVRRGDFGRVLAEFWADGPSSETPPGHWNVITNYVSDNIAEKRLGGTGPVVSDLEWDVKAYLAVNGATHDAAVACWGVKYIYDYVRPISMVRYVCGLGQSSDPQQASYNPLGVPLVPGLVELVTPETTAAGQRHEALAGWEGKIAVLAWPGAPSDVVTQYSGVKWILADNWVPYQRPTFVTPPFAAYTSGHSTFSRAAAEVLTRFTGSKWFPNGLGTFFAAKDNYLKFESGPTFSDVTLQWASYYDAADQAAVSRLWGGIHVKADDFGGRLMGSKLGIASYFHAQRYFSGTASVHSADTNSDHKIDLSELLRMIQFYNSDGFHCNPGSEDGFGTGPGSEDCGGHDADNNSQDWHISLSELLRTIQFYNSGGYHGCQLQSPTNEDGFCPGVV